MLNNKKKRILIKRNLINKNYLIQIKKKILEHNKNQIKLKKIMNLLSKNIPNLKIK